MNNISTFEIKTGYNTALFTALPHSVGPRICHLQKPHIFTKFNLLGCFSIYKTTDTN